MKNDFDLLVLTGVLPVIADIIEDNYGDTLRFNVKKKAVELVTEIRKMDVAIMNDADINVIEQQHAIGLSFRQWIKDHFNHSSTIPTVHHNTEQ